MQRGRGHEDDGRNEDEEDEDIHAIESDDIHMAAVILQDEVTKVRPREELLLFDALRGSACTSAGATRGYGSVRWSSRRRTEALSPRPLDLDQLDGGGLMVT